MLQQNQKVRRSLGSSTTAHWAMLVSELRGHLTHAEKGYIHTPNHLVVS